MTAQPTAAATRTARPTRAQIREKANATTEEKALSLFADGYQIIQTLFMGVYSILWPIERWTPEDPFHHYTVDVIHGTCSCSQYRASGNARTCKHVLSTQNLVFCGVAAGMPDEWIICYYDADMLTNAHLLPEMDTVTTTDLPEDEEDASEWYAQCQDCGQTSLLSPGYESCCHCGGVSFGSPVVVSIDLPEDDEDDCAEAEPLHEIWPTRAEGAVA